MTTTAKAPRKAPRRFDKGYKTCVLTIRDGRDEVHDRSLNSLMTMYPGEPEHHVVIDDKDHELGFAGAIQKGWEEILNRDADFVFHHEADFLFNEPIALHQMISALKAKPSLVQMALKRQPVNAEEAAAGGIIEAHPEDFHQVTHAGLVWTEHRKFFTTNPSVYPANLCALGWPDPPEAEGHFWLRLAEDPSVRAALWGAKTDPPKVEHIGERIGWGY